MLIESDSTILINGNKNMDIPQNEEKRWYKQAVVTKLQNM